MTGRRERACAALLAVAAWTSGCTCATEPGAVTEPVRVDEACGARPWGADRFAKVLDSLCEAGKVAGAPVGATLAVIEGGQLVLAAATGRRCDDRSDPLEVDTPFRVGSITKLYTAQAVRTAGIDPRSELTRWLPELGSRPAFAGVQIDHLLHHTAGLRDVFPDAATGRLDPEAWLAGLEPVRDVDPGVLYRYTNLGYALLGAVLERRGRLPYPAIVAAEAAARGLSHTTAEPERGVALAAACGHVERDGTRIALDVAADFTGLAHGARWALPAGGVIASAPDLAEFVAAIASASPPPFSADDPPTDERAGERYGLGMRWRTLADGHRLLRHEGDTGDFWAGFAAIPERGFVVVALGNGGVPPRAPLRTALVELAGLDADTAAERGRDDPPSGGYAGRYRTTVGGHAIVVTEREDGPWADAATYGIVDARLVRVGDHTFLARTGTETLRMTFVIRDGEPRFVRSAAFVAVRAGP